MPSRPWTHVRNWPQSLRLTAPASTTGQMSNHTVFHKGMEAFNRRDVESFLGVCHPDCEWQPS